MNYLMSNVLSMVALLIVRYALADSFIWKTRQIEAPLAPSLTPAEATPANGQLRDGEIYS
jgi:hypothetical protein